MSEVAHTLIETYSLVNMFYVVMAGMTIDAFEQAVYLNTYEGTNADVIMADGKITYDEYDLLYASISVDLGIDELFRSDSYWRYGMTISSPCYYISYAVSAINALQIYTVANTEGFDAAKDCYLKTITYIDTLEEDEYMPLEEVLTYAGLNSYVDEDTHMKIANFIIANYRK
jgi:oligoendopeptidase F